MKIECDENGAPKMDWEVAKKYYNQALTNVPEGIGLIMSPFEMVDFSFKSSAAADTNAVANAENEFWSGTGTSGMMFGSMKASSSSSLELSVKPDYKIVFALINQIATFLTNK